MLWLRSSYTCEVMWRAEGSNHEPLACKARTLPLRHTNTIISFQMGHFTILDDKHTEIFLLKVSALINAPFDKKPF